MNLITGNKFEDHRGILQFNNEFDLSEVKRMYVIQNSIDHTKRGWQGHSIEKRWYICLNGKFKITVRKIDNWENPSQDLPKSEYILEGNSELNVLFIEPGNITLIETLIEGSKLLVYSNYKLGEVNDEYRFAIEHF